GQNLNWRISNRLPELPARDTPVADLESLAIAQRLDLAAAREQVQVARTSLGLTRATRFSPEVTVGGHFEREPERTETFGPSLDIPIPIFDQGQAAISRGGALLAQSQFRYAALAVEVQSQVRSAQQRLIAAYRAAQSY